MDDEDWLEDEASSISDQVMAGSDPDEDMAQHSEPEEEEEEEEEEDDDDGDYGFDAGADISSSRRVAYTVLPKAELEKRRMQALHEVTSITGISDEDAARVLRRYKWDVSRVHEEWFSDTDAVRSALGLIDEAPMTSSEVRPAACLAHARMLGSSAPGRPPCCCYCCSVLSCQRSPPPPGHSATLHQAPGPHKYTDSRSAVDPQ